MDDDLLAAAFDCLGDQVVIVPVAVARRRVEEVHSEVEYSLQRRYRLRIVGGAAGAGHAHAADTDTRDLEVGCSERRSFHAADPIRRRGAPGYNVRKPPSVAMP